IDDLDRASREQKSRIAELKRELKERETRIETLTENERRAVEAEAAARQRADELRAENASLKSRLDEALQRVESLERDAGTRLEAEERLAREADAARSENDRLRETLGEREARIAQLSAELESVKVELATAAERREQLTAELESAREQIAGLEQELRDEKECTDNLSEVANERREIITRLEDRLAEAEERYEEARWRLGKAQHFERLVKRRKKLIKALIERIRQKHKANVALKAGLDGLRTYKAAAEARQHELLKRIDKLTAKVKEHEETIARHHASTVAKEELFGAQSRINELEKRIEAQVEIIQTLEDELKTAKAMQQVRADYGAEVERLRAEVTKLRSELDAKNKIVERLENDAD